MFSQGTKIVGDLNLYNCIAVEIEKIDQNGYDFININFIPDASSEVSCLSKIVKENNNYDITKLNISKAFCNMKDQKNIKKLISLYSSKLNTNHIGCL